MNEFKQFLKKLLVLLPLVAAIAILSSHIVAVPTNSMYPTVKAGDVVIVQKSDVLGAYSELNPNDVKVGDVVVYEKELQTKSNKSSTKTEENNQKSKDTDLESQNNSSKLESNSSSEEKECIIHRVVAIRKLNGEKYFILKGDNNDASDMERVYYKDVIAKAIVFGGNPITVPQFGTIIFNIKNFLSSMGM